ncbi:hypothetical protein PVK06_020467 [Gossypium arboreum]|uniref:Uncharacterized protein n=1 Tax=Gossypium arboreum TaxID=29729 RepID=A0ABR0PMV0_GOSAR|nr:hypothetical protein PVK06_020467 [Gossypium arboreum]
MSQKKTKSSKTSAENPIVIQDEEAREIFEFIFKYQLMIRKKSVNLESNDKMIMPFSIQKTIDALNWNQFCDARSMPVEELVLMENVELLNQIKPNEPNKVESDELSTNFDLEADLANEIKGVESKEKPNNPKRRVEPYVATLVEPSVQPELTVPMATSSNTMKKSKFSIMRDM